MKFFRQFIQAIGKCFEAFGILFSPGFKRYMVYPLVVWVIMWGLMMLGLFNLGAFLTARLSAILDPASFEDNFPWLADALPFILTTFAFLIKILVHLLLWMISGTLVRYFVLICLSPLFALLSEKTDTKITGREFPFSTGQFLKDTGRGIVISLRNMCMEYAVIILCFVLSFVIPPLIIVTFPLSLFATWYFTGFTLLDYNNERHRLSIRSSVQFMKNNRGLACGVGCVYSLFFMLPGPFSVIGLVFGPAVAVIGATTAFLSLTQETDTNI
jgi:CysZ protein